MTVDDELRADVVVVLKTTKAFKLRNLVSKDPRLRDSAIDEIAERVSASVRGRYHLQAKPWTEIGTIATSDWRSGDGESL